MTSLVFVIGFLCSALGLIFLLVGLEWSAGADSPRGFHTAVLGLLCLGLVPLIGGCVLCGHASRWSKAIGWRPSEPKGERVLRALMFLGGIACVWYGLGKCMGTLRDLWAPTDQMPMWLHVMDVAAWGVFPTTAGMFLCWHPLRVRRAADGSVSHSLVRQKTDAVLSYWFDLRPQDALKFFGGVFLIWVGLTFFVSGLLAGDPLHDSSSLAVFFGAPGVLCCWYVIREAIIPADAKSAELVPSDSNGLPIWRWAILSLVTFGLYQIYWFHENWKRLREHLDVPLSPGWSTAGFVTPIANFICLYKQLTLIHDLGKRAGVEGNHSPALLTLGYALTYVTAACLIVYKWNAPGGELALSLLIPLLANTWLLALVQKTLNSIQRKERPDLPLRRSFSTAELLLLCWSPLVWLVLINAWWGAAAG